MIVAITDCPEWGPARADTRQDRNDRELEQEKSPDKPADKLWTHLLQSNV